MAEVEMLSVIIARSRFRRESFDAATEAAPSA
jgi:hypothetical protein